MEIMLPYAEYQTPTIYNRKAQATDSYAGRTIYAHLAIILNRYLVDATTEKSSQIVQNIKPYITFTGS